MARNTLRGPDGKFMSPKGASAPKAAPATSGTGLASLEPKLRRRTEMLKDNVDDLVRKTALAIVQAETTSTPVDTGRARANWIVSLNAPVGDGNLPPTNDPVSQATDALSRYTTGDEVHVSNSVPYINKLNEGWSKQAPANFVQLAATEAALKVQMSRLIGS